jgi:sulfur carrier protein
VSVVALHVNGEPVRLPDGTTVADVVVRLTGEDNPRGVAVAVDRCIVPRSEWATTPVVAGARVEVVEAAAGG